MPLSHGKQVVAYEPTSGLYVLGGHGVQAVRAPLPCNRLNRPTGQSVGYTEPVGQYPPSKHVKHVVALLAPLEGLYLPALHFTGEEHPEKGQ